MLGPVILRVQALISLVAVLKLFLTNAPDLLMLINAIEKEDLDLIKHIAASMIQQLWQSGSKSKKMNGI